MNFDGYTDDDWDAGWDGIVGSFMYDGIGKPTEQMMLHLTRSQALSADDREYMLRFLQLKYAVLFLQREKAFGKYCFYGCWCLPSVVRNYKNIPLTLMI